MIPRFTFSVPFSVRRGNQTKEVYLNLSVFCLLSCLLHWSTLKVLTKEHLLVDFSFIAKLKILFLEVCLWIANTNLNVSIPPFVWFNPYLVYDLVPVESLQPHYTFETCNCQLKTIQSTSHNLFTFRENVVTFQGSHYETTKHPNSGDN